MIAGLVFIAVLVLVLVICCERRGGRRRRRERREAYEETAKLKRRDSEEAGVDSASEASHGLRKEGSFTQLRDIEPEMIEVSEDAESNGSSNPPCDSIEVLSPSLSPREHGARDEWRRRRDFINLQRKSQDEIIV